MQYGHTQSQVTSPDRDVVIADGQTNFETLRRSLRLLRQKARRLKVWLLALNETERGIVDASFGLDSAGQRLSSILSALASKLRSAVSRSYFTRLEAEGLEAARVMVRFFYGETERADNLLADKWFLRYHGLRIENLRRMGYTT